MRNKFSKLLTSFNFFFLFEAHLQFSPPGLIPGFASDSSSYFSLDSRTHCFFWRFKKKKSCYSKYKSSDNKSWHGLPLFSRCRQGFSEFWATESTRKAGCFPPLCLTAMKKLDWPFQKSTVSLAIAVSLCKDDRVIFSSMMYNRVWKPAWLCISHSILLLLQSGKQLQLLLERATDNLKMASSEGVLKKAGLVGSLGEGV